MGAPFLQNCPFPWGIWTPSNTGFLGSIQAHNPNGILIGLAIFAQMTAVSLCKLVNLTRSYKRKQKGMFFSEHSVYTFWELLPPDGILARAKFTLRPSLAFSYISSVTAWHSSSGPQPNFAAWWYKEWNYGTFAEGATYIRRGGHHIGHRPTF